MTEPALRHEQIAGELAAIEQGIDAEDVRAVWIAALTGWRPAPHLEERVERLRVLRDQVGRAAAARKRGATA
ncbi:MAG: hypothetical protein WAJ85_10110 [Candidatus Baltobacteraceae bacterium]